jgi:hypothetical protein
MYARKFSSWHYCPRFVVVLTKLDIFEKDIETGRLVLSDYFPKYTGTNMKWKQRKEKKRKEKDLAAVCVISQNWIEAEIDVLFFIFYYLDIDNEKEQRRKGKK